MKLFLFLDRKPIAPRHPLWNTSSRCWEVFQGVYRSILCHELGESSGISRWWCEDPYHCRGEGSVRDREVVSAKSGIILKGGVSVMSTKSVNYWGEGSVRDRERLGQLHGRGEGASLGVQRPLLLKMWTLTIFLH